MSNTSILIKVKALLSGAIAIYLSLIVFNNVVDYKANYWCVKRVLTMEGVENKDLLWRSIQSIWVIKLAYAGIVLTEGVVALLCWLSAVLILKGRKGKKFALIGLATAFALFFIGFIAVGGEWFYMYQDPILGHVVPKITILSILLLVSLAFISADEPKQV